MDGDSVPSRQNTVLIDHFSSFPHGGAGTAARRLHERLIQRGLASRFNYWKDQTSQRLDSTYRQTEFFGPALRLAPRPIANKMERRRQRNICNLYDHHIAQRPEKFELFTMPWSLDHTRLNWKAFQSSVMHLHWMAFYIDYKIFFRSVPDRVPIVWSLHDMNPFTGGCHYSSGCSRFTVGCGNCPQLDAPMTKDVSYLAYRSKRRALSKKSLHIVTPNRWLSDLAKNSRMFSDQTCFHVIRLGLRTDVFRPVDKRQARRALNLPEDKILLAFGAEDIGNYRKGFHHLLSALRQAKPQVDIQCLVFGSGQLPDDRSDLPRFHEFGYVDDEQVQANIYSAADMFLLPSREDNQPQTGLEAMACGTPVIAFRAGGIPEYIVDRKTGLLAALGEEKEMAALIVELANDRKLQQVLSRQARQKIEEEFTADLQASKYIQLYREICGGKSKDVLADRPYPQSPVAA